MIFHLQVEVCRLFIAWDKAKRKIQFQKIPLYLQESARRKKGVREDATEMFILLTETKFCFDFTTLKKDSHLNVNLLKFNCVHFSVSHI